MLQLGGFSYIWVHVCLWKYGFNKICCLSAAVMNSELGKEIFSVSKGDVLWLSHTSLACG